MAILTDGPRLEPLDKWTATYLQQLEAAHHQAIVTNVLIGLVTLVVIVVAWIVVPRLWRRVRAGLSGPVRLADPKR